jgi:hypothetical protein
MATVKDKRKVLKVEEKETFTLLVCYKRQTDSELLTFWDNLSVPSSMFKQSAY